MPCYYLKCPWIEDNMAAKMKKMDETSRVCGEMLDILPWNTEFVRGQSRDEGTIGFEE
jgi:hypothetical protein